MIFGITGNTAKENVSDVIISLTETLKAYGFGFIIADSLKPLCREGCGNNFEQADKIGEHCDVIVSIGGDGTMLSAAQLAHKYDKPVVGMNAGKLGFLAEVDLEGIGVFINEIKQGKYKIENRLTLEGKVTSSLYEGETIYAINDFVIDKGGWPKMIEIELTIDNEYVTTFSADGLILATPAGSTGYSLSVGGPIVNPKADVISISPISPHSLTVKPLVIHSGQRVKVKVYSQHIRVLLNCDGQRVFEYQPPMVFEAARSERPLKVLRTDSMSYFSVLRNKLMWGMDLRNYRK